VNPVAWPAGLAGLELGAERGLTARPETPVLMTTSAMPAFTLLLETLMLIEPSRGDLPTTAVCLSVSSWLVGGVCYPAAFVKLVRARRARALVQWNRLKLLYLLGSVGYISSTLCHGCPQPWAKQVWYCFYCLRFPHVCSSCLCNVMHVTRSSSVRGTYYNER